MPGTETDTQMGQVIPFIQDGGYFYKKGIEAYQNEETARALSYFERAIRLEPEEPVFMCQLAIVLSEEGDYEQSNEWLNKIKHDVDPSMSECYFFMANNMAHLGEFETAKQNLESYLSMDEDGEFAEDARSLLDLITKQLEKMEEELTPEQEEKHKMFSLIGLLNKGAYVDAEKEARKRIAEEPQNWDTYVFLAESLMHQNQWHEAGQILEDLLIKEEPNFLAQCEMSVFLYLKHAPEAHTWVGNLVNLRPIKETDCYFLARSLALTGEHKRAYEWYKKLSREGWLPEEPHLFHQMAMLAWHCGDISEARRLWEKIRHTDPEKKGLATHLIGQLDKGFRPEHDKKQFLYR